MDKALRIPACSVGLLLAASLALVGCSAPAVTSSEPDTAASSEPAEQATPEPETAESEVVEPVSLEGTWEQSNKNSEDSYQAATITGDMMEINWVMDGGDSRATYWVGTVQVPAGGSESFTWESTRDKAATDNALMASTSDTKEFSYENGEIIYEVTAMGTTVTVRLALAS